MRLDQGWKFCMVQEGCANTQHVGNLGLIDGEALSSLETVFSRCVLHMKLCVFRQTLDFSKDIMCILSKPLIF